MTFFLEPVHKNIIFTLVQIKTNGHMAMYFTGFREGEIFWDDEDDGNLNSVTGVLPDGVYNQDTKIKFCCRNDGDYRTAISLPPVRYVLPWTSFHVYGITFNRWYILTTVCIFDQSESYHHV